MRQVGCKIADTAKESLTHLENFYRDLLRDQKSQELMGSVWDGIKTSNCVREVCKGRGSYLMTFGFTSYKIARVDNYAKDGGQGAA